MTELLVRFVTQVEHLRVPNAPLAVPGSLDRAALSQVIFHLLGGQSDQLLEFFTPSSWGEDGAPAGSAGSRSLLRGTLSSFAHSMGLSAEAVLTLGTSA